ncbi:MAG TPA: wax ester/triacylglycerol synthase family O-acyltransferase [Solirubrobacterales bacterium]
MAAHLTPLDASFLELEEADESAHMHIGWAMVFDPVSDGGAPPLDEFRDRTAERLELLPGFRRRLSSPRVGSFSFPSWEAEPDFDIAAHMRQASLPSPGGETELLEWLADFYSHRLDRSRPLWETTLIDGLEGGRWALATKVHHCLVDGISGVSVATVLLDSEADPPPGSRGLAEAFPMPAAEDEGRGRGRLSRLGDAVGAGVDTALHPSKLASVLSRSRAIAELLVRDELISAPHTSLNEPIGGTRRLAAVDVSLDELKQIKRELGGTVNDVILAACAGGLRRLLDHRGESMSVSTMRVMVPVSLRQASEALALGNRVSSLFVELPVAEPDPLLRYRKTAASATDLKKADQAAGAETLIDLAGAAPPLIHSVVARLAFTPRLFNITITNVPGPQMTLYAMGAPMRRVIPLVPIFSGHAVGVAVVSYDGGVTFGINADRATVPDLEVLERGIEESLAELMQVKPQLGAPRSVAARSSARGGRTG